MTQLMRHILACNNAALPGSRRPFRLGTDQVGWVLPDLAAALANQPGVATGLDGITLTDPIRLPALARTMAGLGFGRIRGEAFDVRATPHGRVLATIDRGALPAFGIQAQGVHVNGLVRRANGLHLWIARRSAAKKLDPGKLDHIVAGGISAGMDAAETLVKESAEEAAIPAALATQAAGIGQISYAMVRDEGLRRDLLHCYDLQLPEAFTPEAADGEVEAFELWPIAHALARVRDTDDFKFNVNLVLIDLFLRLGLVQGVEAHALRAALDQSPAR